MTQTLDRQPLIDLLSAPITEATGQQLVQWVRDLYGRVQLGDLIVGLLSPTEALRAPDALRRAIDCGVRSAWLDLAAWFTAPAMGDPDLAKAEAALRSAMAEGIANAAVQLVELRWFYQRDTSTEAQSVEAIQLLLDILNATPDDAHALYLLGLLTHQGFGVAEDPVRAFALQRQAAHLGHANAQFELYIYYARGVGVEQNDDAALAALKLAAEAGHPRALYNLGAYYATGRQVVKDFAAAAQWYERAFEAGNVQAAVTLAVMYATGEGVEKDLAHARELFDQAEWLGYDVSDARAHVGLAE